jgi:uncharacterized membrane protein SirB2
MLIKTIHLGCAALTLAGFVLRGIWAWRGSPWLRRPVTRVLPHVVDSALFLTGLTMSLAWHGATVQPWLAAKLAGVAAHITCGFVALRPGRPRGVRAAAFVAALFIFIWIVSVARSRTIVFPLHWLGPT